MPFTAENAAALGAKGGRATVQRHGPAHMQRIAKNGFRAAVAAIERPGRGEVTYDRYA